SDSVGGHMARRVLPFAIAIPVVLGWLERKGREAELYQGDFGMALLVVGSIALTAIVIVWQGAALERIDRERSDATREVKRAFETLSLGERHFRSLIENAQDIITIIDLEGTIRFQSPAAARILARPPEEFVGRSVFEFLHPDDAPGVEATIRRAIQSPESPQTSLFRFRHADGSWRRMEGIGKLLPGGEPPQLVVNSRDITESHALEEQLRQAQKMEAVGRLAGGIAHDFNNLLTVIGGYGELLLTSIPSGDPNREPLQEIVTAGERAASLTRQLLAFSRKQILAPEVLDLNAVVAGMHKMLTRLIGEDVDLVTRLDASVGSVRADPGQLGQVIMNLAVNARDAMPRGGKLTIETANADLDDAYAHGHLNVVSGRYVMLAVSDTGSGMDAETQARIFEPFFTTKGQGKGTGLGLSTVYGIVKQSGGYIWVYSEPEKGTTFKIYRQRVEEAPAPAETPSGVHHSMNGTETILLVEDEGSIRTLARKALESVGYRVVEARSGPDALKLALGIADPIHLLVTDLVMPEMTGTDLASRLLESRPGLRILYMSGYADDAVVRHGLLDHHHHFLPKPFTPLILQRKVRDVLDSPGQGPVS
ncbi:MAG TPA: PAS domain S-box protein, partial [Polyangiaceae bacterium]